MDVSLSRAANAYQQQLRLQSGGDGADEAGGSGKPSFGDMLGSAVEKAIDTQHQAEAVKLEAVGTGKVDLTDLVTAVTNAELTLNTVVAIRDRVIAAYQDILRMPI